MVGVFASQGQPRGRGKAGKGLEVVNEVRLVEISARGCDIHPIYILGHSHVLEYFLKPPDAAEQLWRKTDLLAEDLDEAACAEADLIRNFANGSCVRHRVEFIERE